MQKNDGSCVRLIAHVDPVEIVNAVAACIAQGYHIASSSTMLTQDGKVNHFVWLQKDYVVDVQVNGGIT